MNPANDSEAKAARARIYLMVAHALQHILAAALPVLLVFIRQEMNLSFTDMGIILAAGNLVAGVAQFPAGLLVDRLGAKNLLVGGYALTLGGLLMFVQAQTIPAMLIARVVSGLGNATFHPASFPEMARASRPTGLSMGMALHNVGGNVGMSAGYFITSVLAASLGWRTSLAWMVYAGAALSVFFALTYPRLPANDADEGPAPQRDVAGGDPAAADAQRASRESPASQWAPTVILAAAAALSGAFGWSITSFLPTFLTDTKGLTAVVAGAFSTIMLASGTLGSLIGGRAGDRFDRSQIVLLATIATTLLVVALAWAPVGSVGLAALLVLLGIGHSIPRPSMNAITSEIAPAGRSGGAFGLVFGAMSLGGSLASPLVGYIADIASMSTAFVVIGVCFLLHGFVIRRIYASKISPSSGTRSAAGRDREAAG